MAEADPFDTVLVVDFGAQYAQLIARRVREAHVYSEIVPRDMPIGEMLARKPKGIIFSGGPKSVHVEGAPTIDDASGPTPGSDMGPTVSGPSLASMTRKLSQNKIDADRAGVELRVGGA